MTNLLARRIVQLCFVSASPLALAAVAAPAVAQVQTRSFDIPSQPLGQAILEFSKQADVMVVLPPELAAGKKSAAIKGALAVNVAIGQLLRSSGLRAVPNPAGGYRVGPFERTRVAEAPPSSVGDAEGNGGEEIVVTGTRIGGVGPVGSEAAVIDQRELRETGRTTLAEAIRTNPLISGLGPDDGHTRGSQQAGQNINYGQSVNLRGLGADATLVLLNGRRIAPSGLGSFVDVSQFPVSAVERVEILADGASAIYGSDAVGGVVNVRLKEDFSGADTSVRYGAADGFHQITASQTVGAKWKTGNILASYQYNLRTSLAASERSFFTNDLRAVGGPDLRTVGGVPGTITVGTVNYAIPDQSGIGLTASSLVPGTTTLRDEYEGTAALPYSRQHAALGVLRQELGDRLTWTAEGTYSNRFVKATSPAAVLTLVVPRSNPFFVSPVPGAQTVTVRYSFLNDLGPVRSKVRSQTYNINSGLKLKVGEQWSAELNGTYSRDQATSSYANNYNTFYLNQALADSNPATAFNVFGNGSANSQADVDRISGGADAKYRYLSRGVTAFANGPLFTLPAGDVRIAVGAERRWEDFKAQQTIFQTTAAPVAATLNGQRDRHNTALFGELFIPLIKASSSEAFVQSLAFSGAVRHENYSDFGSSTNPKIGAELGLRGGLSLRTSYGTSFKAPQLYQLVEFTRAYFSRTIVDPQSATGTSGVLILAGNNSNLTAEHAKTFSAGVDFRAKARDGFSASLTYFRVNYRDRIASLPTSSFANLLRDEAIYAPIITRNPTVAQIQEIYATRGGGPALPVAQVRAIVDGRLVNIGVLFEDGLDGTVRYGRDTAIGRIDLTAGATYLMSYDLAFSPTANLSSFANVIGNPNRVRARGSARWAKADVSALLAVNYTGAYKNNTVTPIQPVSAWTTLDLNLSYKPSTWSGLLNGLQFSLDIRNLLDANPPKVANLSGSYGFDPEAADLMGRVIALTVRKSW